MSWSCHKDTAQHQTLYNICAATIFHRSKTHLALFITVGLCSCGWGCKDPRVARQRSSWHSLDEISNAKPVAKPGSRTRPDGDVYIKRCGFLPPSLTSLYTFYPPMPPSENTALLNGNSRQSRNGAFYPKIVELLKAEGEPSWLDSYRWFIFGSWWNLLLLLVPLAAAAHYLNWDAPVRFVLSFIAIIPLAKVCNLLSQRPRVAHDLRGILIPSSAAWKCHGRDVHVPRADPRRAFERHFRERGGNHRGYRCPPQGRSSDRADFRVYPTTYLRTARVYRV